MIQAAAVLAYHHSGSHTDVIDWVMRLVIRALVWIGLDHLLRHVSGPVVLVLAGIAVCLLIMRRRHRSARLPRSRSWRR